MQRGSSLRLRLTGLVLAPFAGAAVVLVLLLPRYLASWQEEGLAQDADLVAQLLAGRATAAALAARDPRAAEKALAPAADVEDVQWVGLWDGHGQRLASSGPAPLVLPPASAGNGAVVAREAVGEGTLAVALSLHGAAARRWHQVGAAAFALLLLGAGAAVAWVVGERVVAPIRELSHAARRVAEGEIEVGSLGLDLAHRDAGGREVVDLTRAMARMGLQLRRKLAEVEAERARAREAEALAQQASQAKSVFLANMSHELRTPLNAVIGYSEMLSELVVEDGAMEYQDDLVRIQRAGAHLLGLIDDILDLARIEAGRMHLAVTTVDLMSLVEEVAAEVAGQVALRGNHLEVHVADDIGVTRTDRERLRQVLTKLLTNAAKFTEGGTVSLRVSRSDRKLSFEVRDTGIGIPVAQIEGLFQPFHQADASATRRFGGIGLGLALASRFAEMLGGCIDVESVPGEGSRFCLVLDDEGPPGSWEPTWDPLAGIRTRPSRAASVPPG
ncbi:MAG: HAMP domain-containing sensor histidine kinase [Myxococcota bacterium]